MSNLTGAISTYLQTYQERDTAEAKLQAVCNHIRDAVGPGNTELVTVTYQSGPRTFRVSTSENGDLEIVDAVMEDVLES